MDTSNDKSEERKSALFRRSTVTKHTMIKIPSLKVNRIKIITLSKRAFFFSSGKSKGSMALEGSMALPVFLFFMMTVLLSLEAVRFQCDMQEALYQAGNENAFAGYEVKYINGTKPNAESRVRDYLGSQLYPYLCVAGGENGIIFRDLSSGDESGYIEYTTEYRLKPFISWLPIGEITVEDRFLSHTWTGYTGTEIQRDEQQEICVYITKTGNKYHLSYNCTYLRVQVQAVDYDKISSLRNQSGAKYYACQRCRPGKGGVVYITADGNSYHGQSDCSSLKRTVYMLPISEAENYSACSKCAG